MSHFVLLLDSYVKSIIIEQSWIILKDEFSNKAKSIDAIFDAHTGYINRILFRLDSFWMVQLPSELQTFGTSEYSQTIKCQVFQIVERSNTRGSRFWAFAWKWDRKCNKRHKPRSCIWYLNVSHSKTWSIIGIIILYLSGTGIEPVHSTVSVQRCSQL